MRDLLKQLFTETDNHTQDIYKYLALVSIATGLVLEVIAVRENHQVFDMQNFGIGIGALFTGVGIALGLKKDTPTGEKE